MLENLDHFFRRRNKQEQGKAPNLFDERQLELLLGKLADAPPEERYLLQVGFYEKMLGCELLLPVPAGTDTRQGLPILALENTQGEKALPLFTSETAIALWADADTDWVTLPFATLCRYAVESDVDYLLVNVAGPHGCEISSYDFHYLADSLLPPPPPEACGMLGRKPGEMTIEKNTPMRLAACNGLGDSLMDRLAYVFFNHQALISRVYLFNVAFNEGPLQPALGIRMPEGSEAHWETDLWPDLQAVLHEMLERRAVVNVFLLNQSGSMETHVRDLTDPIFEK